MARMMANDHGFKKHGVDGGELPGISARQAFVSHIGDMGASRPDAATQEQRDR